MRLACVGDNVVDIYPTLGLVFPGGNAVNVAVAARRAGIESAYLGVLGTDAAGRIVQKSLRAEGLELSHMRVVEGLNAYSTVDVVDGDRVFGMADAGVSRFSLDDGDLEYLASFDLVHTGDNSVLETQVARMAEVAPLSYDFGERPVEYWRPLAPYVRVACFSAGSLDADACEELARSACELGPELVLVTQGSRGAMVLADGAMERVSASEGTLVDTLGAGDSLIGCFLAEILAGQSPAQALRSANQAAAATCAHLGAFGYEERYLPGEPRDGDGSEPWPSAFERHRHPERQMGAEDAAAGGSHEEALAP